MLRTDRLQSPDRPLQQDAPAAHQSHGVAQFEELSPREAAVAFERLFGDLLQRRVNESIIRRAEARGEITVAHGR